MRFPQGFFQTAGSASGSTADRLGALNCARCGTGAELAALAREFAALSAALAREAAVNALLNAVTDLVAATPADTGRARSGWRVALTEEGAAFTPGQTPEAIAEAAAAAVPGLDDLLLADRIVVVNNVAYILALNAGWSKRLPGGFIDTFILALTDALTTAAVTVSAAR